MEWGHLVTSAESHTQAWHVFESALHQFGIENCTIVRQYPLSQFNAFPPEEHLLGIMFHKDWHDFCRKADGIEYSQGFRVPTDASRGRDTFMDLESILKYDDLSTPDRHTVEAMYDFGLRRGWAMPIIDRHNATCTVLLLGCRGAVNAFSRAVDANEQWIRRSLVFFSEGLAVRQIYESHGAHTLTQREADCLAWVAAGRSTKEIGRELALADSTITEYLRSATTKMGAVNRTQAAARAALLGSCLL